VSGPAGPRAAMTDGDHGSLEAMLSHAEDAIELLGDPKAVDLAADKMRRYAVTRAAEVVCSAAGLVSSDCRETLSDVPWLSVIEMRSALIHDYASFDLSVLETTVRDDFPTLITNLRRALEDGSS
jgi:uncharacterized protein with HEPN domain